MLAPVWGRDVAGTAAAPAAVPLSPALSPRSAGPPAPVIQAVPSAEPDTAILQPVEPNTVAFRPVEADTAIIPAVQPTTRQPPAPPATPAVASPTPVAPPARGWWRRNLWGLIALVPVFALAIAPAAKDGWDLYNRIEAHEAVPAGADGWVTYAGARIRLVELAPATGLQNYREQPFTPPKGVRVWRATLAFETSDPQGMVSCGIELEDRAGRRYSDAPNELSGAADLGFSNCAPEDDNTPSPYQTFAYFALPESATPAAIRITRPTGLPRYAHLPAP
ncbi:hypothetical protein WEI85_18405 [Actinomycetes bacterium KLBMP 9797]